MDELFNEIDDTLSPRAEWARKHGVHIVRSEDEHGAKWVASVPQGLEDTSREGEDDVLRRIAQRMHTVLRVMPWGMSKD